MPTGATKTPFQVHATKFDQRAGTMEVSSFIFQHESALQGNCIVMSLRQIRGGTGRGGFARRSYVGAKMAFSARARGVHESSCHVELSLSARLTPRLLSLLSSSVSRPHPSLAGRVHYANDPAGAVSTRRTLRYHFLPPGLFFSPIAHTESWPNSIPLT